MQANGEIILSLNSLTKKFGRLVAVDNLSLNVEKGRVYGLLGPNGSGKSTTLGMILNTINPTYGTYSWYEGKLTTQQALKKIGAIIERPNFYPYLTAIQNLKLVCKIKQCSTNRIEEVLRFVDLWDRRNSKFKTFSLGMKQRLAIASSLINQPEMLILDEPTNGLDPAGIHKIRSLIKEIGMQGTTILLASHLLDEVEKVCTDVIILKNGLKYYQGPVKDLTPSHGYVEIEADDLDALQKCLESHPSINEISRERDKLVLTLKSDLDTSSLIQELSKQNIYVTHLVKRVPTLEERFLELTEPSKI